MSIREAIRAHLAKPAMYLAVGIASLFCAVYGSLLLGDKIFTHDTIIWYGSFHYYVESIASGHFPYWNPYMMNGTYFYPNMSLYGLLDPVVLVFAFLVKWISLSPLYAYVLFRLYRLLVLILGSYLLFRHITRSRSSAMLGAGALLFAVTPGYCRAAGIVDIIYLAPFTMYFMLRFFEDPRSRNTYLYLFLAALTIGLTMNFYIPTYYLFNIAAFVLLLPILRIVDLAPVVQTVRNARFLTAFGGGVVVILLMMAPPLSVMLRDMSADGEMFPMLRIIQKNDGKFKRIMASDIVTPGLSGRYTGEKGVFSSYGNMAQMLYPDAFDSVPFFADDLMAEVPQYVGIIPFVFAILAVLYHKSRYRYLAIIMLVLITINMFSFEGMSGKPYNLLQKGINFLFPPLKMVEVREAFGVYFLFYLCMLAALGFSLIADREKAARFLKERYRSVLAVCGGLLIVKVIITAVYGSKLVFASALDLYVMGQLSLLAAAVFLFAHGRVGLRALQGALLALMVLDAYAYANYNVKYVLQDAAYFQGLVDSGKRSSHNGTFQYYRSPLGTPPGVAFGETILHEKGALTYGNNHSLFATKRYYDLLTHLPLPNQADLSSVLSPVIRFVPAGSVHVTTDKLTLLQYLHDAPQSVLLSTLVIEEGRNGAPRVPRELEALGRYEDVKWLNFPALIAFNDRYLRGHEKFIELVRSNTNYALSSPTFAVEVKESSQNDITVAVRNSEPGYLYYNDGWSRYWRAYDGSREIPVLIANYNSKAVFLPPGDHVVRFEFDPVHYKAGLVLFYAGLAIVSVLVIVLFLRGRKDAQGPAAGA